MLKGGTDTVQGRRKQFYIDTGKCIEARSADPKFFTFIIQSSGLALVPPLCFARTVNWQTITLRWLDWPYYGHSSLSLLCCESSFALLGEQTTSLIYLTTSGSTNCLQTTQSQVLVHVYLACVNYAKLGRIVCII